MPTTQLDLRDQEVLRANRELAAYFRGQRTEREARAALKTIKAFIRERQRTDPTKLRPLPGAGRTPAAKPPKPRKKPSRAARPKKTRKPKAVEAAVEATLPQA